jgi:hypothetical protein
VPEQIIPRPDDRTKPFVLRNHQGTVLGKLSGPIDRWIRYGHFGRIAVMGKVPHRYFNDPTRGPIVRHADCVQTLL